MVNFQLFLRNPGEAVAFRDTKKENSLQTGESEGGPREAGSICS